MLLALLGLGLMSLIMNNAQAQTQANYPARKSIQLVVPYPAGGISDVIARVMNTPLTEEMGQHVIVENVSGGTGVVGAKRTLNSPADGYTVFQGSANEVILAALLNPSAQYQPEDFRLVHPISQSVIVMLAHHSIPANTLDELIDLARQAKGQALSYASVGVGSLYHLMGESIAKRTQAHLLHVPYKGAAPAIQDLAGGQVKLAILPYQPSLDDFVKQGRIKIIGAFAHAKSLPAALQHVQTIDTSQTLKDFEYLIQTGLYVRKDTPEPVVHQLRAGIIKMLQRSEVRAALSATGQALMSPMPDAQIAPHQSTEIQRYRDMLKASGVSLSAL